MVSSDKKPAATTKFWMHGIDDMRGPVAKMYLASLLHYDDRAANRHHVVWQFHLQWAHKDYGHTSLASIRHVHEIMTARSPTGKAALSHRHIAAATKDLLSWGYFEEVEKGTGRRASRYAIKWDLLKIAAEGEFSVFLRGKHKEPELALPPEGNSAVTHMGNANSHSVTHVGEQRPVYIDPSIDGAQCNVSTAAPDGPPSLPAIADSLTEAAGNSFEDAWKAYGKFGSKARSRTIWDKLSPGAELAAHIIERAASWKASANGHRFSFDRWLELECYDEADRRIEKPSAKATETKDHMIDSNPTIRIVAVDEDEFDKDYYKVTLEVPGAEGRHPEYMSSKTTDKKPGAKMAGGATKMDRLLSACGLEGFTGASCLLGREFRYADYYGEPLDAAA